MKETLRIEWMTGEQDQRISEAIEREQTRLWNFIRKRVVDQRDAEDVLQDVFYELVEAYRLMEPVEQVGAWLFSVARNRITDLFRKKKPEVLTSDPMVICGGWRGASLGRHAPVMAPPVAPEGGGSRPVLARVVCIYGRRAVALGLWDCDRSAPIAGRAHK